MTTENVTISALAAATVLDISYEQYASYWQRIGNMQSSAGSVLTIIAIIVSLLVAITSQSNIIQKLVGELDTLVYSFYLSFLLAFIYLGLAVFFTYQVIKPKIANVLTDPLSLYKNLIQNSSLQVNENMSDEGISIVVHYNALLKINEELTSIEKILKNNQKFYQSCLLAAFWSFACSFIALFHVVLIDFFNIKFVSVVICLISYLCTLGIIHLLISFQKK